MTMIDRRAAALIAAGRLLQSKAWPGGRVLIARLEGEAYPQAVARAIEGLGASERDRLRELVGWVREYERQELA